MKFDAIIKILISALISIFLAVFIYVAKDIKTDVREIRDNGQRYYGDLYETKMELEKLKLRVELLGVIPPSDSPSLSVEDLGRVVEMLKNKK